jgi:hypothetical protein
MTQHKLSRTRPDAGFAVAMALTVLCCACTQQKLTLDSCVVRKSSGFVGTGRSQGQITVAENGDPCGMAFVIDGSLGGGFVSDPELVAQPAHGVASAHMSNGAAIMIYTPNRDYVGSDRFAVAFGPNYTTTVDVEVVPLP